MSGISTLFLFGVIGILVYAGKIAVDLLRNKSDNKNVLLILAVSCLLTGSIGYFLELYSAGLKGIYLDSIVLLLTVIVDSPETILAFTQWYLNSMPLVFTSIFSSITIGIAWYIITRRLKI